MMSTNNETPNGRARRQRREPERLLPNETDARDTPRKITKTKKTKVKTKGTRAHTEPALRRTRSLPTRPTRARTHTHPLRRVTTNSARPTFTRLSAAEAAECVYDADLARTMDGARILHHWPNHGAVTGTVLRPSPPPKVGQPFLHVVQWDDGDVSEESFTLVARGRTAYRANQPANEIPIAPPTQANVLPPPRTNPSPAPRAPPPQGGYSLPLPASFQNYPVKCWRDGAIVDAHFTHRTYSAAGQHHWHLQIGPTPTDDLPTMEVLDTADVNLLLARNADYQVRAPSKVTPTLPIIDVDLDDLQSSDAGKWDTEHPIVGELAAIRVYEPATAPPAREHRQPRQRRPRARATAVTVAAAFTPTGSRSPTQFLAHVIDNRSQTVLFTSQQQLAEASHSRAAHCLRAGNSTGTREARRLYCSLQLGTSTTDDLMDIPVTATSAIVEAARRFGNLLPQEPEALLAEGYRILPKAVPRPVRRGYRAILSTIFEATGNANDASTLWRAALLFDSFILAPPLHHESWIAAIHRRLILFLSGDAAAVLEEKQPARRPARREPTITTTDADDARAARAQETLLRFRSVTGAAKRLRAPAPKEPTSLQDATTAMEKLNPQIGDEVPAPPTFASPRQGGGDVAPAPPALTLRRPIAAPSTPPASPLQITIEQALRHVRTTDPAAAGGPTGQSYVHLRTWLDEDDLSTERFVGMLNRIIAGDVPTDVVPILTASRGIALVKDEKMNLRPICIGSVILRFVAGLALRLSRREVDDFFLHNAKAKQFGVGVPSGCNLQALAVEEYLRRHPGAIALSLDLKNAFNSWSRDVMWSTVQRHFPKLEALIRLMYQSEADIYVAGNGSERATVKNGVGSRQGCAFGSFLFCLALQPVIDQLQTEFPDLLILSYCDDCMIVGQPRRAIAAMKRYTQLVNEKLQMQLRPDKTTVYSPTVPLQRLRRTYHLPEAIPDEQVSMEGMRILGCPVGNQHFKVAFARKVVAALAKDVDVVGRCPSLHCQYILMLRSLQHSVTHLLRSIGGNAPAFAAVAAAYDDALQTAARRWTPLTDSLSDISKALVFAPLRHGGVGLRRWGAIADACTVASYCHAAFLLPKLYPDLATTLPPITTADSLAIAPSCAAYDAVAALRRILSEAPTTRATVQSPAFTSRQLQHKIMDKLDIHRRADLVYLVRQADDSNDPRHPRFLATYLSNANDPYFVSSLLQGVEISSRLFEVIMHRRLLAPLYPSYGQEIRTASLNDSDTDPTAPARATTTATTTNGTAATAAPIPAALRMQCPCCHATSAVPACHPATYPVIDAYGDHALVCTQGNENREKYWHDALRDLWASLARMTGIRAKTEVTGLFSNTNKRPDVVLFPSGTNTKEILCDVITCPSVRMSATANDCMKCSQIPGFAAAEGMRKKERDWRNSCNLMGYRFVTLAHEQGTIGDPALALLDELAQRLPRNDQMRFTCHARASLATTNLIGISRVIRSRLNICRGTDGRVLPRPGDAIPPAGCFTRRSLPPIYIRDTTAPLTADRPATEDDPENGPPTERDHSTRPATEREQEDQDIIETESDLPTQESSRDTGWTPG